MTEPVSLITPSGGVTRMSRRVMNLAHFLTQNARRHGERLGFIWGDRCWTWREILAGAAWRRILAKTRFYPGKWGWATLKGCKANHWRRTIPALRSRNIL